MSKKQRLNFIDLVKSKSYSIRILRKILSYFNFINKRGFYIPVQSEDDIKKALIKQLLNNN